jgi:putative Mn2+ efflux pump MntP
MLTMLLLAFSSSIDSIGIGILFNTKKISINIKKTLIFFSFILLISYISFYVGLLIKNFIITLPYKSIGCSILITIGLFIIYKSKNKDSINYNNYKLNKKNNINIIELFLISLSISLDNFRNINWK